VIETALVAIAIDRTCEHAAWLIREVEGQVSETASYYRLLVRGQWHENVAPDFERPHFFTSFDVVADTPEEALEFARRFEPPQIQDSLALEEVERIEARPGDPKGVYSARGRCIFPADGGEEEGTEGLRD
jgi:hypothetical protein